MGSRIGLTSSSAQVNIDFLAGVSIFLVSFLLVVQLVPNLFIPFQGQPVTLHSVGYRTSVILCEDPGWYNGTVNDSGNLTKSFGHNWEDHPDNVSRLGLAKNKFTANLSTPLMLSGEKIETLSGLYNSSDPDSYDAIQEELGLVTSYRKYDYNVSLIRFDGSPSYYLNGTPILMIGKSPPLNVDIEKVERVVSINMYEHQVSTYKKLVPNSNVSKINIPCPSIAIINIENETGSAAVHWVEVDAKNCSDHSYKNIVDERNFPFPLVIDFTEILKKYKGNNIDLDFKFKNVKGYYYLSCADW